MWHHHSCGEKKQAVQEQTVRVKVQQIQTEAVNGEQGFSGTIEESSGASLSFAVSGTIKKIYVTSGQVVGAGQLIAELDPTTLNHAYTIAKTSLEQVQDTYNRMKELHDSGSLPEMQWIQIENELKSAIASEAMSKKSLNDTKLYAPFSGFIASKDAEIGQNSAPGMPIVKLVSIGNVKVKISVPEDDVQRIAKGSSMKIIVPALNNREFSGRVTERGVSADPRSRTYEVKATIQNSDWWGGSHAIKRQKLPLNDAREQQTNNGQKLIIHMNSAWAAVETSYKKLLIARDAIAQAEENLRLNKDYYRVGTTKMSDLLLAQEQYQQTRDRYTDAYADLQTKILEYRQATGQQ